MKTLIAYASKTGGTKKCAKILGERIGEVELCDISKEIPDLKNYDKVIIGGSIRINRLYPPVKKFILDNIEELKSKKIALFISSGFQYPEDEAIKFFPTDIVIDGTLIGSFGGEYNMDNIHGFDKIVVKIVNIAIKKGKIPKPGIDLNSIESFANKFVGR